MENQNRMSEENHNLYKEKFFGENARIAVAITPIIGQYPLEIIKTAIPQCSLLSMIPENLKSSLRKGDVGVDFVVFVETKDSLGPEGSFRAYTGSDGGTPFVQISGSGIAGVIYGVREVFEQRIQKTAEGGFFLPSLEINEAPGLPYRILWTWDHSTNWYLNQIGLQDIGAMNYYLKPRSGFLEDYKRLVDFMSRNRISAVTIYGFLRDNHGGVDAAKELCRYASQRGVRILPGVGINAYGGIYWEGESPYNLSNWLRKNPNLRAKLGTQAAFHIADIPELWFPKNQYTDAACPSKPDNAAFHEEAIAWLSETFDIGGINFETGDYGTCHCDECNARRKENTTWSFGDMALLYPRLFNAAKRSKQDLWLLVEAYWDTILDARSLSPLAALPDEAIYQYCVNRSYWPRLRNELTREYVKTLPRSRNIFRTHMGSQWNGERYSLVADRFASMASLAYQTGMQGMTIFGEVSSFNPANEINYLAFSRFCWNPRLKWDDFVKNDLAPILGGIPEALKFLELLKVKEDRASLSCALNEAREIARSTHGDVYRRWVCLQDRLYMKSEMLGFV